MMKHVAAAVLYAAVSLMGSLGLGAAQAAIDPDEDDDAGLECVEYLREPGQGNRAGGGPLLLSVASRLCGEEIDGAWLARDAAGPAAVVAVHQIGDGVAAVDVAARSQANAPVGQEIDLLGRALSNCRRGEALKVIVTPGALAPATVRRLAEASGYVFSRERFVDGAPRLEFYTDLYRRERST
jgi:hypothetical protein